jgi:hypothetical protein
MKKKRPLIYESLYTINRSFELIIEELRRLQRVDWFRGRSPIESVELAVRETRAWTMFEVLEVLHEHEECAWTRLGRVRNAGETLLDQGKSPGGERGPSAALRAKAPETRRRR